MEANDLQKRYFQYIKSKLPAHLSLVDEISDLLNISNDSAYRRIRGEKLITFDEIQSICVKFRVSLDHLFSLSEDSTVFSGSFVNKDNFSYEAYLKDVLVKLGQLDTGSDNLLYYEAKDVPLFYHFQLPNLSAFKYFFWMRTILGYEEYQDTKFESNEVKESMHDSGKKILDTYIRIPSKEIWSAETLNSSLRQVDYGLQSGVFRDKATAEILYDELETLISHIQAQAECGEKYLVDGVPAGNAENYKLYYNEVLLGHNTLLGITGDSRIVFINHAIINYILTRNNTFCGNTQKFLDNLIRKSSMISTVNEKDRNRFFNRMREKIATYRDRIPAGSS